MNVGILPSAQLGPDHIWLVSRDCLNPTVREGWDYERSEEAKKDNKEELENVPRVRSAIARQAERGPIMRVMRIDA